MVDFIYKLEGTCKVHRCKMFVAALLVACAMVLPISQFAWANDIELMVASVSGLEESTSGTTKLLASADGFVEICGITSGSASYDAGTKTLTLNGVTADTINILKDGTLTLDLVGKSTADVVDEQFTNFRNYSAIGSCNVKGTGTLNGKWGIKGKLAVNSGTLKATGNSGNHAIRCSTLSVGGGKLEASMLNATQASVIECNGLVISRGTMSVTASATATSYDCHCIDCAGAVTVSGGTLTTSASGGNSAWGLVLKGELKVTGGTIKAQSAGSFSSSAISCKSLAISGGSISASSKGDYASAISCTGGLTAKGGSIAASLTGIASANGSSCAALECDKVNIAGGSVAITRSDACGLICKSLAISKGALSVNDQRNGYGISTKGGNLSMTGGTLKVTNAYNTAINLRNFNATSVKSALGNIAITGGKLMAKVEKAPKGALPVAIEANKATVKSSCVNAIKGYLSVDGFAFKVKGNEYKTHQLQESINGTFPFGVLLTSYNGKSTKPKLSSVKFGGSAYAISGVGANAFATKRGAKVKTLTFNNRISKICSRAFKGAKSLKTITFSKPIGQLTIAKKTVIEPNAFAGTTALTNLVFSKASNLPLKSVYESAKPAWNTYDKVAKKAFAKCGKAGGKKLTVTIKSGADKSKKSAYRKLFTSRGMSKNFKLKL